MRKFNSRLAPKHYAEQSSGSPSRVDANGRPKSDVNNPDEAKRARPLIGLTIFTDVTPDGQEWRGRAYNSNDGKDYDVEIKLLDDQHASVKGCVLGGFICGEPNLDAQTNA